MRTPGVLVFLCVSLCARGQDAASTLFDSGMRLAKAHQYTAAAKIFEEGRSRFPKDKRFPIELAGIAWLQKDASEAKRDLHAALALDPGDAYANQFLATIHSIEGSTEAALQRWNRVGQPRIGQLTFDPEPPVTPLLRERAFDVDAGQLFTVDRLLWTESNLRRLGIFTGVQFQITPEANGVFDLQVRPNTAGPLLGGWIGKLLPALRDLPYEGVDLDWDNIGHRAISADSLWRFDPNKRRALLQLSAPWRSDPRRAYTLFADFRGERWNVLGLPFSLHSGSAGASFEIALSSRTEWTLGTQLSRRDTSGAQMSPLFADSWTVALTNRFDRILHRDAERRVNVNGWAELSVGRRIGSFDSKLETVRAGALGTWAPGPKWTIREQTQGGRTFGTVPIDELFALAMERDTDPDLWVRGTVGTLDGKKGNALFGRAYFVSQSDAQRQVFRLPLVQISAGPYFDWGYTGSAYGQRATNEVLYAAGVEARVQTDAGIEVRFIYGRDLENGGGAFYTAVSKTLKRPARLR